MDGYVSDDDVNSSVSGSDTGETQSNKMNDQTASVRKAPTNMPQGSRRGILTNKSLGSVRGMTNRSVASNGRSIAMSEITTGTTRSKYKAHDKQMDSIPIEEIIRLNLENNEGMGLLEHVESMVHGETRQSSFDAMPIERMIRSNLESWRANKQVGLLVHAFR